MNQVLEDSDQEVELSPYRLTRKQGLQENFDPEIERTLRRIRREQRLREDQQGNMADHQMTLSDYAMPNIDGSRTSIVRPAVNTNNFEIKPGLIQMVQQVQFTGKNSEDPNEHLANFLEICDTIKLNGVSEDAIRLRLFPFSLKDKAKVWLNSKAPNSFTTWTALSQAFLSKYFLPGKTAKLRNDITNFIQHTDESLYEAWERYKDLQRKCPHHGLPDWLIV